MFDSQSAVKIFVIIPAYNELRPNRGKIRAVLEQLQALPYTVVVVDDGSTDETAEVASHYARVLRHPVNRGQGAALKTGMEYALGQGADILVHFDADGQMLVEEIEFLVVPLLRDQNIDIVLGSRFLSKKNEIPWVKRNLLQRPALWFQNLTTGLALSDVHNGFRAMSASAAQAINIQQDGMAHASEIVSELKRHHLRYIEVPVTIRYNEFGQGLGGGFRVLKDLLIRKLIK